MNFFFKLVHCPKSGSPAPGIIVSTVLYFKAATYRSRTLKEVTLPCEFAHESLGLAAADMIWNTKNNCRVSHQYALECASVMNLPVKMIYYIIHKYGVSLHYEPGALPYVFACEFSIGPISEMIGHMTNNCRVSHLPELVHGSSIVLIS